MRPSTYLFITLVVSMLSCAGRRTAAPIGTICVSQACRADYSPTLDSPKGRALRAVGLVVRSFLRGEVSMCGRSAKDLRGNHHVAVSNGILAIDTSSGGSLHSSINSFIVSNDTLQLPSVELMAISPVLEGVDRSIVRIGCVVTQPNGLAEFFVDFVAWSETGKVLLLHGGSPDSGDIHTFLFYGPELELKNEKN